MTANEFEHLQIGDLGLAKGKTPTTPDNVSKVVAAAADNVQ